MKKIAQLLFFVFVFNNAESQSLSINTLIKLVNCDVDVFIEKFDTWKLEDVSDIDVLVAFSKNDEIITLTKEHTELTYMIESMYSYNNLLSEIKNNGFKEISKPSVLSSGSIYYNYMKGDIEIIIFRQPSGTKSFIIHNSSLEKQQAKMARKQFIQDSLLNDSILKATNKSNEYYDLGYKAFLNKNYDSAESYFNTSLIYAANENSQNKLNECLDIRIFLNERNKTIYDIPLEDISIINKITYIIANDITKTLKNDTSSNFVINFNIDSIGNATFVTDGITLSDTCINKLNAIKFKIERKYGYPVNYKSSLKYNYYKITSDNIEVVHYTHKGKSYSYYNNNSSHLMFDEIKFDKIDSNFDNKDGIYDISKNTFKLETKSHVSTLRENYTINDFQKKRHTIRNYKYTIQDRGKKLNKNLSIISSASAVCGIILYLTASSEYDSYKSNPTIKQRKKIETYDKMSLVSFSLSGLTASALIINYTFKF